jgi:predicted nucleic acid-binding Zn ribbon protein
MKRFWPPETDDSARVHRQREQDRPDGPVRVGDVINEALEDCGLGEKLGQQKALRAWSRIVGEKIARHSQVVDLTDGIMILEADHGVWRQELTLLIPMIKERYNSEFGAGTVREIRWNRRWDRRQR